MDRSDVFTIGGCDPTSPGKKLKVSCRERKVTAIAKFCQQHYVSAGLAYSNILLGENER